MIVLSLQVLGLLQGALQNQLLLLLPVIRVTRAQLTHHLPDDLWRRAELGITASPQAPCLPPRPALHTVCSLCPMRGAWPEKCRDCNRRQQDTSALHGPPGCREEQGSQAEGEEKGCGVPLPTPCP